MLTENEGSSKPHQKSSETMYVLVARRELRERERERERERIVLCKINRERGKVIE